MALEFSR